MKKIAMTALGIICILIMLFEVAGCDIQSPTATSIPMPITPPTLCPTATPTPAPTATTAPVPTMKPRPTPTSKTKPAPLTGKSHCTPTPFVNEINGSANIANGGFAAIQDGWIYYSYSCDDDEKNGLYKMKVDGTKKVKLCEGYIDRINATGNWIYFYSNYEGIYRINADGTEEKEIWRESDYAFDEVNVVKNQVYVNGFSDEWSLCKMDIHKNKMQVLLNDTNSDPNNLHIMNGWIYFYIHEPYLNVAKGQDIYKMRTNGTKKQLALEGNTYDFTVVGDWIYYLIKHNRHAQIFDIYKAKKDGTRRQMIAEDIYMEVEGGLNVAGDWVYYLAATNKGANDEIYNLYKIKIDGTGRQKIAKGISAFDGKINVVGDWIFYLSIKNNEVILNRIKTDGKDKEIIEYDNSTPAPGDSQDD